MKIQFGVGRRCVNPQVPISLAGYFNVRMWDKVLDDLEVRALVFKHGPDYAAILQFDLVTVPLFLCDLILDGVRKAGIRELSRENLLICATHTHTGPEVRNGRNGSNSEYVPFAAGRAVEALQDAIGSLREGELVCGQTADPRFIFNRRYWMKNGKVLTNPGKLNAAIRRPEGEIDPDIPLLGIRCNGKLAVLVSSIVNHTDTIGGNGVSADWPGFLRRALEGDMGESSMLMPLVGASGNINHFDVSTDMPQTQYAEARRIGTGYAETIRKAIPTLLPVKGDSFRYVFGEANACPREISEEEIAEAKAVMAKYPDEDINGGADMTSEDLAKGAPVVLKYFASVLLNQADYREPQRFFLTGFSFGSSVVIASLPSEPFTEIGLTLRKEIFAGRICMVAALANGTGSYHCGGGYIPNAWNYGRGGYETTPRSNPFSMKTSAVLLEKWRELSDRV